MRHLDKATGRINPMTPKHPPPNAPSIPIVDDEERRIVGRVQQGDVAAFDSLVRRYLDRALVVARRISGNAHDAEDLVQDSFIRALERIATFDNSRPFAPWFFRLLTNTGLNARRARAIRMTEPETVEVPAPHVDPYEAVERLEIRERFDAALAALPDRQRLVVSMFEVDGLSSTEIAEVLGIAPETVRWHLHQARRVLRAALAVIRD
jgi:RNA polymerase sigma-70 factor (ECF subfamily)